MIVGGDGDGIRNRYVDLPGDLSVAPPPGRVDEIVRLSATLDDLVAGRGGVVLLAGDGGVGKTTLSAWASEEARSRGMTVLEAPCFELSIDTPYGCLVPAFGPVLRGESDLDPVDLVAGLHSLGLLFDGIDTGGSPVGVGADDLVRSRLHGALTTLVSRLTTLAPVVLAVDDLHWADAASIEVLQALVGDLPHVPLLIVATLRPFESAERVETRRLLRSLRAAPFTTSVDVGGLDEGATRQLVERRLGSIFPNRLVGLVHRRSGGTPLVAEELLEVMIETGALRPVGRRWELEAGDDLPVPAVADELIGDRLDRLGPDAVELVAAVSVAGRPEAPNLLADVLGKDRRAIPDQLEDLRRAGVVDRTDDRHGVAWVVHHPIIGEVAVRMLGPGRVATMHAAFVAHLPSEAVDRRAHHLVGAGLEALTDARVGDLVAAGQSALARAAPDESCRLLGFALDAIDDGVVGGDRLIDVLRTLGVAWSRRGEYGVAAQHLDRARQVAHDHGDVEVEAAILVEMQQATWGIGRDGEQFVAQAEKVLPRLEAEEAWGAAHRLARTQLTSRMRAGDHRSLPADVERLAALDAHLEDDDEAQLWSRYLRSLERLWRFEDGTELLGEMNELLGLAEPYPELERRVLHERLDLLLLLGSRDEILAATADERAWAERHGDVLTWRVGLATWDVAMGDGDLDRTAEVEELLGLIDIDRPLGYLAIAHAVTDLLVGQERVERVDRDIDRPADDPVLEQALLYAQQWRDADDREAADAAIACWETGRLMAGMPIMAPVGAALAHLSIGDPGGFDEVLASMERFDGGGGRTTAWARVLLGEASSGEQRAAAYRDAAERFGRLGRPFDAAVCNVAAAEAGAPVGVEELTSARELFDAGPTPWMSERVVALLGDGGSSSAGRARPLDDLGLTAREREVAEVVAEGLSNREVANRLFISVRTVTSHLDHIYTKLGIGSRRELTRMLAGSDESPDT